MNDNWKFLAGLGVGLVLASLLALSWPQRENKLAVIKQARSLGMIFPQEGLLSQSEELQVELRELRVEPQLSAKEIATLLMKEGIISEEEAFLARVQERGLATKFIAGNYRLAAAWTLDELLDLLTGQKK